MGHAQERLKARTRLPPSALKQVEAVAAKLSPQVPPGRYYLPLNDKAGNLAGYAAMRTVGKYPDHKLVVTTVLGPNMRPRGTPLSHVGVKEASLEQGRRDALFKYGKLVTDLKPHQERVVERMQDPDQPGLVVVHGLGSGKTLTSIAVADALGIPADVVVPSALQANYQKEIDKHTKKPFPHRLHSLENVARRGPGELQRPLLVVDEAHRLRNYGKSRIAVESSPAEKRLALTGSLLYNHPSDMAGPINIAAGADVLPANPDEFSRRYIRERDNTALLDKLLLRPRSVVTELNPERKKELQRVLSKYVDYYPGSTEGFPVREDQVIRVPMTADQRQIYDSLIDEAPSWVSYKVRKNLPPTKAEAKQLNAFLTGARQAANVPGAFSNHPLPSPKVERAAAELKKTLDANPRAKAVIYSNFIEAGIDPYRAKLEEMNIPYGEFTGDMPRKVRDQLVKDYNANKIRALLLSSAGGEGLDLKGTRLIQILEPHWNEEKLKQVIGRGIRYKSHEELPEEERKVLVQKFLATRGRHGLLEQLKLKEPGSSVDEYLDAMSQKKEDLNRQFIRLLAK